MNKAKFTEVINFAIRGEKEAIKFYQELQEISTFRAQKEMLKEFENMEKGHIVILENIRSRDFNDFKIKKIVNLNISDNLEDVKPSKNMDYQDILIIAMKKEDLAQKLYMDLSGNFSGNDLGKLFLKLASEEAAHKLKFEKLYDEYVLKDN